MRVFGRVTGPVLAALLLVSVTVAPAAAQSAQKSDEGNTGVGIKVGPIFNNFQQASVTFKGKIGFIGGFFFGGNRRGPVGVEAEVLLAQKKAQQGDLPTANLTYIEVPILLRLNIGQPTAGGLRFFAVAGPAFDVRIKATQGGNDVSSNWTGADVDLSLGAGLEVARVGIEGRWIKGFRNIQTLTTSSRIRTNAFAVMLGVRFN